MLSRFQTNDIAKIRNNYSRHILYNTLNNACLACCEEVKSYSLRPEQIFVEIVYLIDELKQQQEDVTWGKLYRSIRQDYQMQDAIADDDLERVVTTIICALASILAVSYTTFYHQLAQILLAQIVKPKTLLSPKALDELMDGIEAKSASVAEWMKIYMESDTFESDAFREYFSPVAETDKGTPKHIQFTATATSEQKSEFKSLITRILTQEKKHGMAGTIKCLLNKYVGDGILILFGTEKDVYNDLTIFYEYKQVYSTFSCAKPKLIMKKLD